MRRNGDLRVAYRASRDGPRATSCSSRTGSPPVSFFRSCHRVQGWVEAMTSLGRLIFFDQPGTGASDPVTPGALPTLEQWADSITAVLDDLGSREAVLVASNSAFATAALFAATYPSRTTALVALEGYADPTVERTDGARSPGIPRCPSWHVGHGRDTACSESGHAVERGDPGSLGPTWNAWQSAQDATLSCTHSGRKWTCGRSFRQSAYPPSSSITLTTRFIPPEWGKDVADRIPGREIR